LKIHHPPRKNQRVLVGASSQRGFSTQIVIEGKDLEEILGQPELKIFNSTVFGPNEKPTAKELHAEKHIPGYYKLLLRY